MKCAIYTMKYVHFTFSLFKYYRNIVNIQKKDQKQKSLWKKPELLHLKTTKIEGMTEQGSDFANGRHTVIWS